MKVFTAYFAHETNSFSPVPTDLDSFRELGIHRSSDGRPDDLRDLKVARAFYLEAEKRGDEVHPGLCAHSQPSSPTNRLDYETLRGWLLDDLREHLPGLDMILIMMHGSMMAEGYDDCEGDVLSKIRDLVGPDIPIGLLLDLHCNVSPEMLRHATIIKACKEYPHTDFDLRARELYDICARCVDSTVRPAVGFQKVPMLGLFQTAQSPMRELVNSLLEREKSPDVLSITLAHGFPWSDHSQVGASVITVTNDNQNLADDLAATIGEQFYALRETGQVGLLGIDDALDAALATMNGTVVIADMSDNPGGGAGSDSTFVLRRMVEREIGDAAVAYIWDPAAVNVAFAAGEGNTVPMQIGGKVSADSGDPVELEVRIRRLRDDATQGHIVGGDQIPLGRTATVSANGIDIVLNDIRQQPFTPMGLEECGLDPWGKRILIVKSSHHFYEGFHRRAARIIYCDAPGLLNSDVRRLPYERLTRPIWPLDDVELTKARSRTCG